MPVDSRDKATEIRILSLKRTHMRGFWASTFGFFMAFIGWFAMAPLMTTIKKELHLTKDQIYNSNILGVSATVLARVIIGPLCDRFGARLPMAWTLLVCALPLGCAALVQDATGLYITRFLIGFVGGAFVPCQYWTTAMFTGKIVGSANALAGGWGNLGGGVTQGLTIGIFEMFKAAGCGPDMAWRMSLVVPAVAWVITAVLIIFLSDDCPNGKWKNRPETVTNNKQYSVWKGIKAALKQPFTWILIVAYATGFGVELHVNKSIAAYFEMKYELSTSTAGMIATLSGLMNLFSRACGGFASDWAARKWFLRGRMWIIVVCLTLSGSFLCTMSVLEDLWAATLLLVIFSIFCQASCGSVYGLVPFVDFEYGGIVSGFVGAGGSIGAMCWGFVHKAYGKTNDESTSYMVIGLIAIASAALLACGRLHGAALLPCFGSMGMEREMELSKMRGSSLIEDLDPETVSGDSAEKEDAIISYETAYEVATPTEVLVYPDVDYPSGHFSGVHPTPTPTPEVDSLADFESGMPRYY